MNMYLLNLFKIFLPLPQMFVLHYILMDVIFENEKYSLVTNDKSGQAIKSHAFSVLNVLITKRPTNINPKLW